MNYPSSNHFSSSRPHSRGRSRTRSSSSRDNEGAFAHAEDDSDIMFTEEERRAIATMSDINYDEYNAYTSSDFTLAQNDTAINNSPDMSSRLRSRPDNRSRPRSTSGSPNRQYDGEFSIRTRSRATSNADNSTRHVDLSAVLGGRELSPEERMEIKLTRKGCDLLEVESPAGTALKSVKRIPNSGGAVVLEYKSSASRNDTDTDITDIIIPVIDPNERSRGQRYE
ncbi:uncharacterized protein L201_002628 [Kwoniella dendrophila CBS 6074]|uniref:Uncharacterized protein n=1 Tax=Kwoniella dendrophila CBS 6074 TaxID=1295534 RepID=A0AAX4JQP5_9TREE